MMKQELDDKNLLRSYFGFATLLHFHSMTLPMSEFGTAAPVAASP
jgi:hypothetical protein